jgi:hypothetical protein
MSLAAKEEVSGSDHKAAQVTRCERGDRRYTCSNPVAYRCLAHSITCLEHEGRAHLSPGQAMGQLPETLDGLRENISRIEAKLQQRPVRENSVDHDTPALVEYARDTLRSGMTLFDGSVAGSTVDVNSVIGGEQAAVANKTVAEWIASAERTGHARQDVMPEHVADINTNADTLQHSEPSISSQGEYDYESDDEQAEFAKAAFEAGSCAFDKQDWPSATG